jgi:hypothetical protein
MQPTKMPKIEGEPVKAKVPTSAGTMRRVGCGLIVGTLAGLLVTLAILRWRMYDPTPPLSAEALRAARQRWRERGRRTMTSRFASKVRSRVRTR